MRIIAGDMRGRKILAVNDFGVRPISGRIKQSLFDILKVRVGDSRFLDLFAGTGAVGLEALSRGAQFVFFVEMNRQSLSVIGKNIERTGVSARAKAHPGNALADLSWVAFRSGTAQYDLIFMGPPYKDAQKKPLAYSNVCLARVAEAGLLAPGGWIIGQHHVKEEVKAPEKLEMFRREKYGDTYLSFFRWK